MSDFPLEPDREQRERWLKAVSDFVQEQLDGLATAPAVGLIGPAGERRCEETSRPIPEEPTAGGMNELLERLGRAVDASLNAAGPGYLAYIPGGGIPTTALADFISDSLNRFTGLAAAAPALARFEGDVLVWLAAEFGLGDAARGLLTSGGSLANLSAIVTAREERLGSDTDLRLAVVYTSSQAHHSVRKCVRLAGIPAGGVREVRVDERFRMDTEDLAAQLRCDRAAGRRPFLVVAAAGTTNTGAIDPLSAIADLCAREGLWLHIDGAYGAAFNLCDEGRRRLQGIARADSITFDPHKGLFLPYGTGCLLVRDGEALRRAHSGDASYLQDLDSAGGDGGPPSPTDLGPELSRSFRGLRLWLPLMLHGARAFREALTEKLELAERIDAGLTRLLETGAPLEIVDRPQLSISSFRLARRNEESLEVWNARSRALLDAINARRRVFLSSTTLPVADGAAYTLRTCVLSFRTHAAHADAFLEDLSAALSDCCG